MSTEHTYTYQTRRWEISERKKKKFKHVINFQALYPGSFSATSAGQRPHASGIDFTAQTVCARNGHETNCETNCDKL